MKKIYYIGDWAVQLGPVYAETSFNHAAKGLDFINYGHWLKEAIESDSEFQVKSVPTWEFYNLDPGAYEKILDEYDIIIFSDVEAKNFQLNPSFFNRKLFGSRVLTFPDRIRLTIDAVKAGLGVVFMGGWLSFNGEMGKSGWGRTPLREILPVNCLKFEDLRESTEGFKAAPVVADHPILKGINLETMPPVLGFNQVIPREDCEVLAVWHNENTPALAAGQFSKGRTLAYTSDPAPHWGCNFVFWQQYAQLWINVCRWLTAN